MKILMGIVGLYLAIGFPVYALLCAAGREDERMERLYREEEMSRQAGIGENTQPPAAVQQAASEGAESEK